MRHSLGISQETLDERADLHRTYIAGIEAGARNVTLKSIDKLARALQVSIPTLLLYAGRATALAGVPGAELVPGENVDILMVEDNKDDIDLTLRAFKQARILNSIQVAHDGEEALDFLFGTGRFAQTKRRLRPQLVLLDLHLPRVPGLEVMRRMMADERTRHIPVVVLTASRDAEELAECQRLGAKTFMVKPVDFQGLSQVTPPLHLDWMLLKSPVTSARPAGA